MPTTVPAEEVGWSASIRWIRDIIEWLRPEHVPVDPVDRLTWATDQAAMRPVVPPAQDPP